MKNKLKILITGLTTGVIIIVFLILSSPPTKNPQQNQLIQPTGIALPISLAPNAPPDLIKQEEADRNFSNEVNKIYSEYFWYDSLPLTDPNYFVYFDLSSRSFIGNVYSSSNNLSLAQTASIKNSITERLKNLGVDLQKYPIAWVED